PPVVMATDEPVTMLPLVPAVRLPDTFRAPAAFKTAVVWALIVLAVSVPALVKLTEPVVEVSVPIDCAPVVLVVTFPPLVRLVSASAAVAPVVVRLVVVATFSEPSVWLPTDVVVSEPVDATSVVAVSVPRLVRLMFAAVSEPIDWLPVLLVVASPPADRPVVIDRLP